MELSVSALSMTAHDEVALVREDEGRLSVPPRHSDIDLGRPFAFPSPVVEMDLSPLRYPGGKRRLAPFVAALAIASNFRPRLLVEPFAGGASVSLALLEAGVVPEIELNDLDPIIGAFWRTVFDPAGAELLAQRVEETVPTLEAWRYWRDEEPEDVLDAAFKFIFLNRTNFSGSMSRDAGPIGGISQAGAYKIGCRYNATALAARIRSLSRYSERVRRVTSRSALDIMAGASGEYGRDTLWYLDPPFFAKADKLYRRFFDSERHVLLRQAIGRLPGRFVLSYDECEDAERLYGEHRGYRRVVWSHSARVEKKARAGKHEILVTDLDVEAVYSKPGRIREPAAVKTMMPSIPFSDALETSAS